MSPTPSPLSRLLTYAKHHRNRVSLATLFSVLNKLFDLAPPALIGMAVDVVVEKEGSLLASWGIVDLKMQLIVVAVLTVIIWAAESGFEYAFQVMWRNLAQTIQHEMRLDAYSHTQNLEMGYHEDKSTGGLMSVINNDVNQLERFLDGGANSLIQVATTCLAVGVTFFVISPEVALLAITPIPAVPWGSFRFQSKIAPKYEDVRKSVGSLNSVLANNLGGISTIKSFTAEAFEVEHVDKESRAYMDVNRSAIKLSSAFSPLIRMVIVVGFVATLVYGGWQTFDGTLAVGAYSVLIFLTQRLLWPLTRLGATFDLYQRAMASTKRILDLLDTPVTVLDGPDTLDAPKRGINFRDISFVYPNGHQVFENLNLEIPSGKTVAFVGSTGAGKTSVIKLLLRFYDPTGGSVEVDGKDIREVTKTSLRDTIGLVSQDVFLFDGTVADNIAYGADNPSRDQIIAAATVAEAHEFITSLPDGYDTLVGERGQKLSGGQRQRLSIARAVLKNPPVLVLDEATSAVDNETEAAIQRSLAKLAENRTVAIIAHRLSTIRHADIIYVLDRGSVSEQGQHETLLEAGGIYARLWAVQTGEIEG